MWICLDYTRDVIDGLYLQKISSYTASLQNKTENAIWCLVHVLKSLWQPCAIMKFNSANLSNWTMGCLPDDDCVCVNGSRGLPAMYTEVPSAFIILRLDESWNLQLMISKSTDVEFWVEGNMAVVTTGASCHALSSEMDTEAFGVNWLG